MATKVNLRIDQGSTYKHTFTYTDELTDLPVPLTGYSCRAQIRPFLEADDADLMFDGDDGAKGNVAIVDAPNGKVLLTVPASISDAWTQEEAVYDVEVVDSGGEPFRIVQGQVFINKQVTRT